MRKGDKKKKEKGREGMVSKIIWFPENVADIGLVIANKNEGRDNNSENIGTTVVELVEAALKIKGIEY